MSKTEAPPAPAADATPPAEKKALPTLASGGGLSAIIPQNIEQVWRLATILCEAEMTPKSLNTPAKATVAIMHGMEVGLMPLQAVQSIAVINNMPSIYGDAMLALVISKPVYGDHHESIEFDDQGVPWAATCRAIRKGGTEWRSQTITRAQAQKAGWWGKQGPWTATPQRMLQMRARGWCLRDTFPDVLRGLVMAEEAADIVDVTPHGSATVAPPPPRRSDFKEEDHHPGGQAAAGAASGQDAAAQPEADKNQQPDQKPAADADRWQIDAVGQGPKLDAFFQLLDGECKTEQDVEDLKAAHRDFLAKCSQQKQRDVDKECEARKAQIAKKAAGE